MDMLIYSSILVMLFQKSLTVFLIYILYISSFSSPLPFSTIWITLPKAPMTVPSLAPYWLLFYLAHLYLSQNLSPFQFSFLSLFQFCLLLFPTHAFYPAYSRLIAFPQQDILAFLHPFVHIIFSVWVVIPPVLPNSN